MGVMADYNIPMTALAGWCGVAILVSEMAKGKGYDAGRWLLYGLLLPPVAFVRAFRMRDAPPEPDPDPMIGITAKQCPMCAELVQPEARLCRYCGTRFGPTVVVEAIRPTPAD